MENCARVNPKSTREKIRFKISIINFFSYAISGTLAGLRYGYFSSICLMISSSLYYRYLAQFFFARLRRASVIMIWFVLNLNGSIAALIKL